MSIQLPRGSGLVSVSVVRGRETRGVRERKYEEGGGEGGNERDWDEVDRFLLVSRLEDCLLSNTNTRQSGGRERRKRRKETKDQHEHVRTGAPRFRLERGSEGILTRSITVTFIIHNAIIQMSLTTAMFKYN